MHHMMASIGICLLSGVCFGMQVPAGNAGSGSAVQSREWGIALSDLFPVGSGDLSLECVAIHPDERRDWSLVTAYGYESFRGVGDQGWQNNGLYGGLNFGTRLGPISDASGVGFQAGFTLGLYDWEGNAYRPSPDDRMRQDFVSYGLFKRATEESPFVAAVTQDWMITDNSSAWGQSLTLSQVRLRGGYATSASNEFGILGTTRVVDDTATDAAGRTYSWRSLNHLSAYWHHKWAEDGVNTIITIGLPERDRANGDGTLGDFLATATVQAPFNDNVGFFGNIMYMNPSVTEGFTGSHEDAWSFTLGIEIFPGHDARSRTIAGERWMPLLPVANNGNFLLDWARR